MTMLYNRNIRDNINLKRIACTKINLLISSYKNRFDIESIYFNNPIDGINYYKIFPHYSETVFIYDWNILKGSTLIKVLKELENMNFYGFCRTRDNKLVKIIPKKK